MKRRDDKLAQAFAADIKPLMPEARRAFGQQKQGTPEREASDLVNALLLEFDQSKGNLTQLADELEGHISLAGLRRRMRVARAGSQLGQPNDRKFRGNRDPELVAAAVKRIKLVRDTPQYGQAIRDAYDSGLALSAIAAGLGANYYTAWSAMQTSRAPEPEPAVS